MHYRGVALSLSSAAVLSINALTLLVYEVSKVGDDLHWAKGLDFFGNHGLIIAFISHWNNKDGDQTLTLPAAL